MTYYRFKDYTEAEALLMVKENGCNLCLIKNQTEEICLEAVKQESYALQYVENQTEQMCFEAVKEDSTAIIFVEKYYPSVAEICDCEEYKALAPKPELKIEADKFYKTRKGQKVYAYRVELDRNIVFGIFIEKEPRMNSWRLSGSFISDITSDEDIISEWED